MDPAEVVERHENRDGCLQVDELFREGISQARKPAELHAPCAIRAFQVAGRDPLGLRLGDVWAQTQVVDGKVVSGARGLAVQDPQRAPGRVMFAARGALRGLAAERSGKCASR